MAYREYTEREKGAIRVGWRLIDFPPPAGTSLTPPKLRNHNPPFSPWIAHHPPTHWPLYPSLAVQRNINWPNKLLAWLWTPPHSLSFVYWPRTVQKEISWFYLFFTPHSVYLNHDRTLIINGEGDSFDLFTNKAAINIYRHPR